VKLNLGYPKSPPPYGALPQLVYSGQYYRPVNGDGFNESLQDPVSVAIYRHFLIVAEAQGNAVSVLTVDLQSPDRLLFVTDIKPTAGIQLTGNMAVPANGYVWLSYIKLPSEYGVASIILPEALRVSPAPSAVQDMRQQCVNISFLQNLIFNKTVYDDYVSNLLSVAKFNWRDSAVQGYIDPQTFNYSGIQFNFYAWNQTVMLGRMLACKPPPAPTLPPFLSANENGWNTPGGQQKAVTGSAYSLKGLSSILLATLVIWS
jgi:hypothetical protein